MNEGANENGERGLVAEDDDVSRGGRERTSSNTSDS